ncbi:DUF2147 domain-containing protein [Afifella marina]|uniref:Uncharacterized conserved protein, DUF2147 family n=1 Tax=Afifella marina DSM 2698 TaxID=1120955 RepID=A0A1G5NQY0_AFIMA|nr:DUF2147 domain-containing protein [Afifella marina]MBK1624750.1 DUF2147 domain-containing protein [Afifella marina DSM 2698]MBK1628562.1 DUF2147 domain-containing protein [Afifella marina]MBK5915921.1 hypothetical protein [Afifella marina]RAI20544.1 hypothetical protein CH311_09090 [Afifella marina DSM 2698]SCZ39776.1 Uncharacterized conserved protein, DUF2147 family [Afifella marina DSM 2698]
MKIKTIALIAALVAWPALAAADPLEGNWVAATGNTVRISSCGDAFCMKVTSGPNKGKEIGRMKGSDGKYKGTVVNPEDDKTYSGSATLTSANSLKLKGCALGIFCKTQNWQRR